jgi:hypothetical protein
MAHYNGENQMKSLTRPDGVINYRNCKSEIIQNVGIALNALDFALYETLRDKISPSQFRADCDGQYNPLEEYYIDGRKNTVRFLAELFEIGNCNGDQQYNEIVKYIDPIVKNLTGNTVSVNNDHGNLMKVIADAMAALVQYEAEKNIRANPLFCNPAEMIVDLQKQLDVKNAEIEQLKKQLAAK